MTEKMSAFMLEKDEWIKLADKATGKVRVLTGEQIVFPDATEEVVLVPEPSVVDIYGKARPHEGKERSVGVHKAVKVDHATAVLVLDRKTGEQRLVTPTEGYGNFFPSPYEEILEVRKVIFVEPHEVVVVMDKRSGHLVFHGGKNTSAAGQGTAFFLPPYCELLTMYWGSGTSSEDLESNVVKNAKTVAFKVPVTKIDLRAQYAFFEYGVRTSDNVELLLEGTIFWQVKDVPLMISRTSDPKGDIWYHVRSAVIQAISRLTLKDFMGGFNAFAQGSMAADESWYTDRGIKVHNVEVIRYECKDARTEAKLQEIIQETTDKINRMQKQSSTNEVETQKMLGEIEVERQRTALIQTKADNDRLEKTAEGEAQGLRLGKTVEAFLDLLATSLPEKDARLALFESFERHKTTVKQTESLASGNANLFLTPQDLNLKLQMPAREPRAEI
jgi:hypothetical protein